MAAIDILDSKILTLNKDVNISGNVVDSGTAGAKILSNNILLILMAHLLKLLAL